VYDGDHPISEMLLVKRHRVCVVGLLEAASAGMISAHRAKDAPYPLPII